MKNVPQTIQQRINELKSKRVHLRPFIISDKAKIDQLDMAISELEWAHRLISNQELHKAT